MQAGYFYRWTQNSSVSDTLFWLGPGKDDIVMIPCHLIPCLYPNETLSLKSVRATHSWLTLREEMSTVPVSTYKFILPKKIQTTNLNQVTLPKLTHTIYNLSYCFWSCQVLYRQLSTETCSFCMTLSRRMINDSRVSEYQKRRLN